MESSFPSIQSFLLHPTTLGVLFVAVIATLAWIGRRPLRDALTSPERRWRIVARLWAGTSIAFLLWGTFFDNWLQLANEPYRRMLKWGYEREVIDPVPTDIRAVTIALLVATAILSAMLFARYVGGYGLQFAGIIIGIVVWLPFFILRQRLDILVHEAVGDGGRVSTGDFVGWMLFWTLRTVFCLGFLTLGLAMAVLLIAPVVTLVLDLLHMRRPPDSREANDFFRTLSRQASTYEEGSSQSLHARWRPIERPS
ncbi:MAG: hypothetical protein QM753_04275 [Thermomicrobiales bacterium]